MRIRGARALITGASSGIGRALARELASRGAVLALVDCDAAGGAALLDELASTPTPSTPASSPSSHSSSSSSSSSKQQQQQQQEQQQEQQQQQQQKYQHFFLRADLTSPVALAEAFSTAASRFSGLDIVFNNAGIVDEENWRKMLAVNLTAVIDGTLRAAEIMRECNTPNEETGERGVIINTASLAGILTAPPMPAYCASKHGVVGFSRSMSPLAAEGIRVCALCPSFTNTPLVTGGAAVDAGFAHAVKSTGQDLMPPELVAEAMIKLVEETEHIGAVMSVTPQKGIDLVRFRDPM